jgi:hypothetical protein
MQLLLTIFIIKKMKNNLSKNNMFSNKILNNNNTIK